MPVDPLGWSESVFWDLRWRGLGFAEIGRQTGVTRQAVYKALLKADRSMAKALRDVAGTYKVDLEKVDLKKGMAAGYSHALGSRVFLVYSPQRGILTWYEYNDQCKTCPRREECRSIIVEEARRLGCRCGIDPPLWKEPAELAEEVLREAWPEGFA